MTAAEDLRQAIGVAVMYSDECSNLRAAQARALIESIHARVMAVVGPLLDSPSPLPEPSSAPVAPSGAEIVTQPRIRGNREQGATP